MTHLVHIFGVQPKKANPLFLNGLCVVLIFSTLLVRSVAPKRHSLLYYLYQSIDTTMKTVVAVVLLALASTEAFAPAFVNRNAVVSNSRLAMSEEPAQVKKEAALVPIKEETVEFTAGLIGGAVGFAVGGPILGAIGAAAANYASKLEGDVSEVIQAVSKSSIQVFNYLSGLDAKYEVLSKAQDSLQKSYDKLKGSESVDPETLSKVESALESTKNKLSEINDEYDLVGGGMTALGVVGDLVEKAIKKAGELNSEYKLSDKALTSLKTAVDKAKDAQA